MGWEELTHYVRAGAQQLTTESLRFQMKTDLAPRELTDVLQYKRTQVFSAAKSYSKGGKSEDL